MGRQIENSEPTGSNHIRKMFWVPVRVSNLHSMGNSDGNPKTASCVLIVTDSQKFTCM